MIPLQIEGIKPNLYYIEKDGRIYSITKKDYLLPRIDKDGYLYVFLQKTNGGRDNKICKRIATLVILSFIGPPPSFMKDPTINHIDGNKINNYYTNLEWVERSINSSIRQHKGEGETNHQAILTEKNVKEICELLINTTLTYQEIGDKYSVSKSTISSLAQQKTWKNITKNYNFSCRKTIKDPLTGKYKVINTNILGGGK